MTQPSATTYVLHPCGLSDFGIPYSAPDREARKENALHIIRNENEPKKVREILAHRPVDGHRGNTAPLLSALSLIAEDDIHLVLLATEQVRDLAEGIQTALRADPEIYDRAIGQVTVVISPSLEERAVAQRVTEDVLDRAHLTGRETMSVVWGSGATQLILGALDAVLDRGLPWTFLHIGEGRKATHRRYDPTEGLPIDPVVPLLRRWHYHDLITTLVDAGLVEATPDQRQVLAWEDSQWGHALTSPTAENMRALLAAALVRGDATSGFAIRQYLRLNYGASRQKNRSPEVVPAKAPHSGQRPMSRGEEFARLKSMSQSGEHELQPPTADQLAAVRSHLEGHANQPTPAAPGLPQLPLVPGNTVWYVAIYGEARPDPRDRSRSVFVLDPILREDPALDQQIQAYPDLSAQPIAKAFLVLGTASKSYPNAVATVQAIGDTARSGRIDDAEGRAFSTEDALGILGEAFQARPECAPGAVVLVPSGRKDLVLSLLDACQRLTLELGIPLYLRQLVNANQSIKRATFHRVPLRFGASLSLLTAARHTLDIVELDTAASLLDALSIGSPLAAKARQLSNALRNTCRPRDAADTTTCPPEYRDWSAEDLGRGLIADRIEVWAEAVQRRPDDVALAIRAILGAKASAEASVPRAERESLRPALDPLNRVRNKLPITHGEALKADGGLPALIKDRTGHRYHSAPELLTASVVSARKAFGSRTDHGVRLAGLVRQLRDEIDSLIETERARLSGHPAG